MWRVDNKTPYAAQGSWVRNIDGEEVWVVAVKASYDIVADGTLRLSAMQAPVIVAATLQEGLTSLRAESDLCPARPATDVLLVGHACAQGGRPVAAMDIAWRVGPIRKVARIVGDRHWKLGLFGATPTRPQPFERMPLTWERAFAHADLNPVGCGVKPDAEGRVRLPNVESIDHPVRSRASRPLPVGFGPIASHWQPRRRFGGTYDSKWMQSRRPLLPKDIDSRHWQSAPKDQQIQPHIRGGETVSLINLTPAGFVAGGRLAFVLPRVTLAFDTRFLDGSTAQSRSVIHTVIIDTDIPRVSILHHMSLACHAKVNLLDRTIVREKSRPLDRPCETDPSVSLFEFDA